MSLILTPLYILCNRPDALIICKESHTRYTLTLCGQCIQLICVLDWADLLRQWGNGASCNITDEACLWSCQSDDCAIPLREATLALPVANYLGSSAAAVGII
ncbi:unnamed protein product [Ostreobium quekettii]|uniref:Uncharacterized protein n=1 Tax=Ostreobium quekettii TaxID=121088 RepID=A0A8S1INW8_9CHLO|nr:unnamed protein product [Ostreobium quekettii]